MRQGAQWQKRQENQGFGSFEQQRESPRKARSGPSAEAFGQ